MPGTGGFTLVELLVVMIVMAVLSGAILPSVVNAVQRTGLRSASARVLDLLGFAHAAAIGRRMPVTVLIDTQQRACRVRARRPTLPWMTDAEQAGTELTLVALQLPEGISVSVLKDASGAVGELSDDAITFAPDGTAEDAVIELSDDDGNVRTIQLLAATGAATLVEEGE